MSFRFPSPTALPTVFDILLEFLLDANIPVFAAAGNDHIDASIFTPAKNPKVCTIGNTNKTDSRFSGIPVGDDPQRGGSNFGKVVKLWAPGTLILSTSNSNVPTDPDVFGQQNFANMTVRLHGYIIPI